MIPINLGRVKGAMWYSGDSIAGISTEGLVFPESGITFALEEDCYINTRTGQLYQCVEKGDPNTAKWVFITSIKNDVILSNDINDTDKNTATTAYVANRLYNMIQSSSLKPSKIVCDYYGTVAFAKVEFDAIESTTITLTDANGDKIEKQYTVTEHSSPDIMVEFAPRVISEIDCGATTLVGYTLYDEKFSEVYSYRPNIWDTAFNLMHTVKPFGTITDDDGANSYRIGNINAVVNGNSEVVFPTTHVKNVWYDKEQNTTLDEHLKNVGSKLEEFEKYITSTILDKLYPIGKIEIMETDADPSTIYGGRWEKIEDRFLLGSGTRNVGDLGGEEEHTLTEEEMARHSHTFEGAVNQSTGETNARHGHSSSCSEVSLSHSHGGTTENGGAEHSHKVPKTSVSFTSQKAFNIGKVYNGSAKTALLIDATGSSGTQTFNWSGSGVLPETDTTKVTPTHKHTFSTDVKLGNHAHTVTVGEVDLKHSHSFKALGTNSNTGNSVAHNNMPPYYVVHIWKRVA